MPNNLPNIAELVAKEVAKQREEGIYKIMKLHVRALACHCECLGMNAENAIAVCGDTQPPFDHNAYCMTMAKWGLTNEKGEPII